MKILFFSTYFFPYISGLTIYPYRVLDYLSKKNQITVLTFNNKKNVLKIGKLGNKKKIRIYYLPYLFRLSKGFISPISIMYFIKMIKKNDVLLLNLPNFEGLVLAILGKIFQKQIISIYHCQVDLGVSITSKIIIFFLNLSVYVQSLLSTVIVGNVDYIDKTFIGKTFKKKVLSSYPPIKISPISVIFEKKLKEMKKEYWIGFVGRIAKEKGVEYLIQSVKEINAGKKMSIKLIFAGPNTEVVGEKCYYLKILDLLKKSSIDYLFLNGLNDSELSAFYKIIDVLALPSINQTESFGMVQAETMLSGTPVIVTNLPGVRIPVTLTGMGIIIEPKNIDQLKKAIWDIFDNKKKYINKERLAHARSIFNINKVYNFYEKILSTINKS